MKSFNALILLIIFVTFQDSIQRNILDNIIIPKTIKSKMMPTKEISMSNSNESEPILKTSPKINLPATDFTLIEYYKVLPSLYIDTKDSEYDGISLIAEALNQIWLE